MSFPRALGVGLDPVCPTSELPFGRILGRFIDAEFDPARCRDELERRIAEGWIAPGLLRPGAIASGQVVVDESVLFPRLDGWKLCFRRGGRSAAIRLGDRLDTIGDLLRQMARVDDIAGSCEHAAILDDEMRELLTGPDDAPVARWPAADRPGLYRREHASLLVRSGTTSLVIDPIALQTMLPSIERAPLGPEALDGVIITHSHGDHFHLPSIFQLVDADVPVVVPVVPRPNLLTRVDFAAALRSFGQTAIVAGWGTSLTIGDIEIDALPFYGEQPTRRPPGPASAVRSWGNCYRFTTPQFSAMILVDSGADPLGDMLEVVRASVAARGPVDVVLACLRSFDSPFFGGLESYWATLPFSRLRELFDEWRRGVLPSTTAGPDGTARLCAVAGARYFLPYANGFEGVHEEISDVGWVFGEPSEATQLERVRLGVAAAGAGTKVCSWRPGDVAHFCRGQMVVEMGRARPSR
jgi:hypothetical protein